MWHKLFSDVRFWIVLFFVVRMFGISDPPLEIAHNWRQTTVTMVARNFYETDPNIFYPRVDFAGEKTGITGMEFPFLNYLIYMVSLLFGYTHWYGRLINLIVSSIGTYYFYKIIRKYFEEKIAFYSTLVLITSIWFVYSRKIMPDTFSMSLVLIGFYYGLQYLEDSKQKLKALALYFLFLLVGIASKLPSGFILILFIPLIFDKKIRLINKFIFGTITLIYLIPIAFWYFYWVPYLVEKFGFWHFFMGKDLLLGTQEILANLNDTSAHFYDNAIKYIGFAVFLFGLGVALIKKDKIILNIFILSFLAFIPVMAKSGYTFAHHSYYIIPFVPVMAFVSGYGLFKMGNKKLTIIFIVSICIEGVLNQQHEFFLKKEPKALLNLEKNLDSFSKKKDLIVINSGAYPTPMYFAHRKGWIATNDELLNKDFVESLKRKGCKYIVVLKLFLGSDVRLNYEQLYNDKDFSIYIL
jgi:4-amino-4-deoxy-L-arabinose transferase-like glycosyltransferase